MIDLVDSFSISYEMLACEPQNVPSAESETQAVALPIMQHLSNQSRAIILPPLRSKVSREDCLASAVPPPLFAWI